jgi:hypothetical protein
MSWQASLGVAIASGVLVPLILWIGKSMWSGGPIPRALSRTVRRPTYLSAVLAESRRADVVTLDVLAPRLQTASSSQLIRDIQVSWKCINDRGRVRVLTLDSDACIEGGAELLRNDIEVRVARRDLGAESLSFHIFETGRTHEFLSHGARTGGPAELPARYTARYDHDNHSGSRRIASAATSEMLMYRYVQN